MKLSLLDGALCAAGPASATTRILYDDRQCGRFKTLIPLLEGRLACGANDNVWLLRLRQPWPCSFCCDL